MASFYLGRSEAEWTQLLGELKAEHLALVRGDRFMQVSSGGKQYTRKVRNADDIRADIAEVSQALSILNPTTYGNQSKVVFTYFGASQDK